MPKAATTRRKLSVTPARPRPDTIPILAQVYCTADIMGNVIRVIQRVANPKEAPATA
jgi:hypothetical protein